MKRPIAHQQALAFGFVAAALAWPSVAGSITFLLLSPYDRALANAYCGAAPHLSAGHCAACWIGAAALFLAGLSLAFPRVRQPGWLLTANTPRVTRSGRQN